MARDGQAKDAKRSAAARLEAAGEISVAHGSGEKNPVGHYPYQVPIDAYGNGGFRFAGMSHRGSLFCLPEGMFAWDITDPEDLSAGAFDLMLAHRGGIGFVLLGTGATQIFQPRNVNSLFSDAGLGLDVMDTGAAARTYNVLLAEGRPVAAALVAVD